MGDLQDPTDGGTLVPYCWPYFGGISPYIGLKNMVGTSNYLQFKIGSWVMAIDEYLHISPAIPSGELT